MPIANGTECTQCGRNTVASRRHCCSSPPDSTFLPSHAISGHRVVSNVPHPCRSPIVPSMLSASAVAVRLQWRSHEVGRDMCVHSVFGIGTNGTELADILLGARQEIWLANILSKWPQLFLQVEPKIQAVEAGKQREKLHKVVSLCIVLRVVITHVQTQRSY